MIRVVIADDHPIIREGLRNLLESSRDIAVVGEAEDGQQALDMVEEYLPDILLVDISMPRINGFQVTERIRSLHLPTQIIIMSAHTDQLMIRQAYKLGARGYLVKKIGTQEIMLAIHAIARGEMYVSSAITDLIMTDFINKKESSLFDRLSPREREVLQHIVQGCSSSEIAKIMTISPRTVEKHRASLAEKLGVHNTAALIRIAIKHHLVSLDD
jgi:DNA-binding NarL/FixJ family response regulator